MWWKEIWMVLSFISFRLVSWKLTICTLIYLHRCSKVAAVGCRRSRRRRNRRKAYWEGWAFGIATVVQQHSQKEAWTTQNPEPILGRNDVAFANFCGHCGICANSFLPVQTVMTLFLLSIALVKSDEAKHAITTGPSPRTTSAMIEIWNLSSYSRETCVGPIFLKTNFHFELFFLSVCSFFFLFLFVCFFIRGDSFHKRRIIQPYFLLWTGKKCLYSDPVKWQVSHT